MRISPLPIVTALTLALSPVVAFAAPEAVEVTITCTNVGQGKPASCVGMVVTLKDYLAPGKRHSHRLLRQQVYSRNRK